MEVPLAHGVVEAAGPEDVAVGREVDARRPVRVSLETADLETEKRHRVDSRCRRHGDKTRE